MSQSFTTPLSTIATVPLIFTDATGATVPAPTGGSVTVDNSAVVTVTLAVDDTSIAITGLTEGTATIAYTNGSITATLVVTVAVAGVATAVTFDTAHATFAPA